MIHGWETSGILTLQSGRPFTVLLSRDNANVLGSVDRPVVVGDPTKAGPVAANPTCVAPTQIGNPTYWINPCAFVSAPAGVFGNEGRNNLTAPGFKNVDLVLSRVITVRERYSAQIRVEAFNLFNHPNFDAPNQTLDGAGFAAIPTAEAARQLQFGLKLKF
jgi:hypothetical protein